MANVGFSVGNYSVLVMLDGKTKKSVPPAVISNGDPELHARLGKFIAQWSIFENISNDLTDRLLRANRHSNRSWHTNGYKQRKNFMLLQWQTFAHGFPTLRDYLKDVVQATSAANFLRDSVAHKNFEISSLHKDFERFGWAIIFMNSSSVRPYSKPFFNKDLDECSGDLVKASGRIYWLFKEGFDLPFSPEEIVHLKQLSR